VSATSSAKKHWRWALVVRLAFTWADFPEPVRTKRTNRVSAARECGECVWTLSRESSRIINTDLEEKITSFKPDLSHGVGKPIVLF
jgi:hypothetical protein